MNPLNFSAAGKLMLFGEYLVLRGAKSIAIPLSFGQSLTITEHNDDTVRWSCFENGILWLDVVLSPILEIIQASDHQKAVIVKQLLEIILKEKPRIKPASLSFIFEIDFHRNYGFGTSSTFISLLSQWSGVDPYFLLKQSFAGSGFDIAAATADGPIVYQVENWQSEDATPVITRFHLPEEITGKLLFVYLGVKQKSSREIALFKEIRTSATDIAEMNTLTEDVSRCKNIEEFEALMNKSEQLMSGILKAAPVKSTMFPDYAFSIKSLGAWGGDFIMASFREEKEAREYFLEKGMAPIFNYQQLIKK